MHMGTRNARLEPDGARVIALVVEPDGVHVQAFVPTVDAGPVVANLEANGQVAVACVRPVDDRAVQIKGAFVSVRPAEPAERDEAARQWQGFVTQLQLAGIPASATARWSWWPCVVIRFAVQAAFDQTPGPAAGERL